MSACDESSAAGESKENVTLRRIGPIGLAAFLAVILAGTALAAATVNLGTAESFAVLAGEHHHEHRGNDDHR